jgi:spermidine/putrescine transport system ATP-binding protein
MSVIKIQNITKQFPGVLAVDDVSFEVSDGEFVTILGPSGSGKSTLLRMIAGFEDPTAGTVQLGGQDITDDPPFDRNINMMFQDHALFPHLTVHENVEYGLKRQGVSSDERRERVESMLEMVRLGGYGDRDPSDLSGGEQQRVALARALVNRPELVLFDEPLASLDRKLRQHMQFELQRIQREMGTTFLYVTHDQEIAMSLSDRLVLLNQGETEQIRTVQELYDRPETHFVANFIGDVNTLSGEVTGVSDGYSIRMDDTEKQLPEDITSGGVSTGEAIDVCVRPHEIELGTSEPKADDRVGIPGEVTNRVYKGQETTYRVATEVGEHTVTSDNPDFEIGDSVYLTWLATDSYLFSNGTASMETEVAENTEVERESMEAVER